MEELLIYDESSIRLNTLPMAKTRWSDSRTSELVSGNRSTGDFGSYAVVPESRCMMCPTHRTSDQLVPHIQHIPRCDIVQCVNLYTSSYSVCTSLCGFGFLALLVAMSKCYDAIARDGFDAPYVVVLLYAKILYIVDFVHVCR